MWSTLHSIQIMIRILDTQIHKQMIKQENEFKEYPETSVKLQICYGIN